MNQQENLILVKGQDNTADIVDGEYLVRLLGKDIKKAYDLWDYTPRAVIGSPPVPTLR